MTKILLGALLAAIFVLGFQNQDRASAMMSDFRSLLGPTNSKIVNGIIDEKNRQTQEFATRYNVEDRREDCLIDVDRTKRVLSRMETPMPERRFCN